MGYPVLKNEHEMHDVGRWQYRPFTLGRLGLPDRLPFSDCQVKAILQVDAGGSEEPMFGYDPNATNKAYNGDLHVMQGEWTKYNSQLKLRAQDEIGSADADVQIQSARNGWRRSLMKSRAQNTKYSGHKDVAEIHEISRNTLRSNMSAKCTMQGDGNIAHIWSMQWGMRNTAADGTLLRGRQFEVEHGADEVGELGVAFGCAGDGIERRLRIGFGAAGREFGDGGFENYECHIIVGYNPPIMADTLYVDHGDLCLWVAD